MNFRSNTPRDEKNGIDKNVTPKGVGNLDMVIAFDTTGSMAAFIDEVRTQVKEMIPRLFKDNQDLQLGIVAFGDYCDMQNATTYGKAYQCMPLTNNENDLIHFVNHAHNTGGGDGDEFYELVLKKIIEEMPWRADSNKTILLIADAEPHELGYTFRDYVVNNRIDWREEARKAAEMGIKIDTVSIHGLPWYEELSAMTDGVCVPFRSSGKTSSMIETAATTRSAEAYMSKGSFKDSERLRTKLCKMHTDLCHDDEYASLNRRYQDELDEIERKMKSKS